MKRYLACFALAAATVAGCNESTTEKAEYIEPGQWIVTGKRGNDTAISWAKFNWTNDSLGNRYYEKTAMFIPVRLEGLPYLFTFQFDLGCDLTFIYGENAESVHNKYYNINFEKPVLLFGDIKATTPFCVVNGDYGSAIPVDSPGNIEPLDLGTIGVDMFQNRVLIIDYPNGRFSICDTVPPAFTTTMSDITLDKRGRALLPLHLHGKTYKVLFDNGSSIFQLITATAKADQFSTEKGIDTIQISSWGKLHNVIGRPIKDSFILAGQHFSSAMLYADYRAGQEKNEYDAITGNAFFLDKVVIVDFKNKKFGIK